jgi:hypothetical protein
MSITKSLHAGSARLATEVGARDGVGTACNWAQLSTTMV